MAKARSKTTKTMKLDMMSVTVLLVMSIFAGVVGYYLGKGAVSPQMVSLQEATAMMKDNGASMQDAGKMMHDFGQKAGDQSMMDKGQTLQQNGSMMSSQADGMMGMMRGY